MKKTLSLLAILLMGYSLFAQVSPYAGEYAIHLKLDNIPKATIAFLDYYVDNQKVRDSLLLYNGAATFRGRINEPLQATLSLAQRPQDKLHPYDFTSRNSIQLLLYPGQSNVQARDSLKGTMATGNIHLKEFYELQSAESAYRRKYTAPIYEEMLKHKKEPELYAQLREKANRFGEAIRDSIYIPFIARHRNTPVGLLAFRRYAGSIMDLSAEPLFGTLDVSIRNLPTAKAVLNQFNNIRKTAIGQLAPDFTQPDSTGRNLTLSALRGKYVLLDFWASWCGPCRLENPNLVSAYQKYGNKNFTILSVSLDRAAGRQDWLKAIKADGLTWLHVSDLSYFNNAAAKLYGIQAIPQNFLIGPDGKILAKNLTGEHLKDVLAKYL
ncbi:TlpA disulfide reductase family protein [Pedobacter jeongneungensis]|uniref:TlpA disulfide reductase family protein n=1 Tax=Pedobacter jeongneungensis TaxID=947309 RepID=UPI00046A4584|nr:TlpA disulfide reductase family protein [Pedobacter jeongneungensis]